MRSSRTTDRLRAAANHYELPYRLCAAPGRVLVVGSGTGNDVAAALRSGATRVDAVEIDPAILEFGALHPEKPYADPRVRAITEDARQHLRRTRETYDLVVYGLLDSHTLLSGRSNVPGRKSDVSQFVIGLPPAPSSEPALPSFRFF